MARLAPDTLLSQVKRALAPAPNLPRTSVEGWDCPRLGIITWIERTYHRRRRQRRLGRLTPVEYETLTPAAAAA